jgi:2-oxoglutarate dehydrogenase E1 component
MSSSKNLDSKKTSFLNKSNSAFIEQMYLKFISNDSDLPQSWKDYFTELDEEKNLVIKEINGPSWKKTKKIDENIILKKYENIKKETLTNNKKENLNQNVELSHRDSVRAVTLIRAYRTQGNLLAKLDP